MLVFYSVNINNNMDNKMSYTDTESTFLRPGKLSESTYIR